MKKLSLLLLIITATLAISCGNNTNSGDKKVLVVAASNATEKYSCPMKCQGDTAYTTVGQCPICEMDLTKSN